MANFFESHTWRATIHKAYSIGASIVVLGALFKLEHMAMASTFLTVGLCTEALIFFISAFEPFPRDVDWTIVFPELAGTNDDYDFSSGNPARIISSQRNSTAIGENILSAINPDAVKQLEQNIDQLNKTSKNLVDISAAAAAAQHYTENMENVAESAGRMAEILQQAGEPFKDTAMLRTFSANCTEELEAMNKNLNALNAVYELQLKETNQHLRESLSAISNIARISEDAQISGRLSLQYQTNLTELNQNLASLNKVYGNMLAAMNIQK